MDTEQVKVFSKFSGETLIKAGDILLSYREKFSIKKTKDPLALDIATSADYAAEECIVGQIRERFPDHSILTEETASVDTRSDYRWIIDPLDGTKEYVRHSPYFYTLLALQYQGKFICGAGYQPEVKRMFIAGEGIGLTVNGHVARPSSETSLAKSFISVTLPYTKMGAEYIKPYLKTIEVLTGASYRLRNTPWDVEALFNVATGLVEAYVMPPHESGRGPKLWDIASGVAAVLSSGGRITDYFGGEYTGTNEKGLVASNGKVHQELLDVLQNSYR